jgi:two-component system phosphate regulon sensor histidine kinase PhoR
LIYRRTLLTLAGFAVPAALVALLFGAAWGWGSFALASLGILFWHTRHLARLGRWLAHPLPGAVPEGQGIWEEVLAALHRLERETARREESLADGLARMRRAVQALPDGVVILDSANRIEWFNRTAEAQLQLDPATDLGQNIANLVREPEFIDYLNSSEDAVRIARGPALALSLQLIPFGQSQKMLLSRDVTQAERVDVMRRDFVANVSHELRTPLTVLVGFLETVRELKLDAQRQRDYLGMMQDQATRMQRIIEDLLTLSALDSAPLSLASAKALPGWWQLAQEWLRLRDKLLSKNRARPVSARPGAGAAIAPVVASSRQAAGNTAQAGRSVRASGMQRRFLLHVS